MIAQKPKVALPGQLTDVDNGRIDQTYSITVTATMTLKRIYSGHAMIFVIRNYILSGLYAMRNVLKVSA